MGSMCFKGSCVFLLRIYVKRCVSIFESGLICVFFYYMLYSRVYVNVYVQYIIVNKILVCGQSYLSCRLWRKGIGGYCTSSKRKEDKTLLILVYTNSYDNGWYCLIMHVQCLMLKAHVSGEEKVKKYKKKERKKAFHICCG